ncbi:unnamed protein product [Ectocarpus fasciculatus]
MGDIHRVVATFHTYSLTFFSGGGALSLCIFVGVPVSCDHGFGVYKRGSSLANGLPRRKLGPSAGPVCYITELDYRSPRPENLQKSKKQGTYAQAWNISIKHHCTTAAVFKKEYTSNNQRENRYNGARKISTGHIAEDRQNRHLHTKLQDPLRLLWLYAISDGYSLSLMVYCLKINRKVVRLTRGDQTDSPFQYLRIDQLLPNKTVHDPRPQIPISRDKNCQSTIPQNQQQYRQ